MNKSLETELKIKEVKRRIADSENPVELVNNMYGSHPETTGRLEMSRRSMAYWDNPVEVVNNMYGSHPGENGVGYFQRVFSFA